MELSAARWCVTLLSLFAGLTSGLQITSSSASTPTEVASGQSVKLDCQFTLASEDSGPLDIEWSLVASDNQKDDQVIILYSGDRAYENYDTPVKGRVHFNSPDPKNGDASVNILTVKPTDTGTYQCKVKKAPGVRNKKMQLVVLEKPSKPRCYTEGSSHEGKDVVLRCTSDAGSKPMTYSWEKTTGSKVLPASSVLGNAAFTRSCVRHSQREECICQCIWHVSLHRYQSRWHRAVCARSQRDTYPEYCRHRRGIHNCCPVDPPHHRHYPVLLLPCS
ncbi:unnamed protein product [Oreochromis niloticus]|nr:unnamed protein product [Mustela putorius furo]